MPEQEVFLHQTIANEETFAKSSSRILKRKKKGYLGKKKAIRRNASEIKEHNMKKREAPHKNQKPESVDPPFTMTVIFVWWTTIGLFF